MDKENAWFFVKLYAVLYWVLAGFLLIAGIVLLGGSGWIAGLAQKAISAAASNPGFRAPPFQITGALFVIVGIVLVCMAVFYFFVALGVWKRMYWARVAVLVLSLLGIFSFPFGTLIGGFAIYLFGFDKHGIAWFKKK